MGMELIVDTVGITKSFGAGHAQVTALDQVSLHVVAGEVILIMGPSGSGKSTLLQIMGGMLRETAGTVLVNGADVSRLSARAMMRFHRNTVGFIYQTPNLLPALTARENVEIVLNLNRVGGRGAQDRALSLLDDVGLASRADHLPEELSGGEQQRVGIARALANSPTLILADEPTASLDSQTGYTTVERLRLMATERGAAVVIVTHDARIRGLADRILWLEDGKLGIQLDPEHSVADPVCLMLLDSEKTYPEYEFDGRTYHFCSTVCRDRFAADPDAHITYQRVLK